MNTKVKTYSPDAAKELCNWVNHAPDSSHYFSSRFKTPLEEKVFNAYWEANHSDSHKFYTFTENDGRPIGHFEIKNISFEHQNGTAAHVILSPNQRGNGLGTYMIKHLQEIGFDELGLHRIGLSVHATNTRAIGCYLSAGFKIEGLIREVLMHGGQRQDLYQMSILAGEKKGSP